MGGSKGRKGRILREKLSQEVISACFVLKLYAPEHRPPNWRISIPVSINVVDGYSA